MDLKLTEHVKNTISLCKQNTGWNSDLELFSKKKKKKKKNYWYVLNFGLYFAENRPFKSAMF